MTLFCNKSKLLEQYFQIVITTQKKKDVMIAIVHTLDGKAHHTNSIS